jgi:hypothetical protein
MCHLGSEGYGVDEHNPLTSATCEWKIVGTIGDISEVNTGCGEEFRAETAWVNRRISCTFCSKDMVR